MITSIQAIQKLKNDIISLIQSGKLNATYHQSKNTVSFYVNDIDTGAQKRLTLRVSDHHPTLQRYVKKNNDLPNYTNNLSIEFYKPVYLSSGKRKPNKTNRRVRVPSWATKLSDFSVSIYNYKPQYLDPVDITTIYNAILKWFNDTTSNPDAKYIDPFKNTQKEATTSAPISKLRENKQYRNTNAIMKQKQTIKLNETQLRGLIKESVKKMLKEGKIVNNKPLYYGDGFDHELRGAMASRHHYKNPYYKDDDGKHIEVKHDAIDRHFDRRTYSDINDETGEPYTQKEKDEKELIPILRKWNINPLEYREFDNITRWFSTQNKRSMLYNMRLKNPTEVFNEFGLNNEVWGKLPSYIRMLLIQFPNSN